MTSPTPFIGSVTSTISLSKVCLGPNGHFQLQWKQHATKYNACFKSTKLGKFLIPKTELKGPFWEDLDVSKNRGGPPKSSIFIGFGTIIFTIHFGVSLFLETAIFPFFEGDQLPAW